MSPLGATTQLSFLRLKKPSSMRLCHKCDKFIWLLSLDFSGDNRRLQEFAGVGVPAAQLQQNGHSQGHSIHVALQLLALLL